MWGCYRTNISHAAITNLNSVLVKYLMKKIISWKMLFYQFWTFGMVVQQSLARLFNSHWHNSSIVAGKILQQSLARFFNSGWHNSSIFTGAIVQQSLARLFNSRWHDIQQSLAWLFNSHWHDYSTVAAMTLQQSLAQLFNSHWHNSSTVTGTILQPLLAQFFNSGRQDFFFFLCWQNSSTVMFTVEELCHVPGMRHMIPPIFILQTLKFTNVLSR